MRVLITGASGFIGKSILRVAGLKPDELMLCAADMRDRAFLKKYSRNVIIGDLKDLDKFKKAMSCFAPQVCVHLAWQNIPDYSFEVSKKNLDNSLNLINFLVNETGCKKIIISGSCMEYGKVEGVCRETDTINSYSFFSWAKNSLYSYCRFVCEKAKIDLVWFRMFYVYGPNQRKDSLIPSIANALRVRQTPKVDYPLNANDFVNCADAADAFCIAIKRKIPSGIYNLGSGRSAKVIFICRAIEKELTGKNSISNRILKNSRTEQRSNFRAYTKKTEQLLGWHARIGVSAGIKQYIKSLKV